MKPVMNYYVASGLKLYINPGNNFFKLINSEQLMGIARTGIRARSLRRYG